MKRNKWYFLGMIFAALFSFSASSCGDETEDKTDDQEGGEVTTMEEVIKNYLRGENYATGTYSWSELTDRNSMLSSLPSFGHSAKGYRIVSGEEQTVIFVAYSNIASNIIGEYKAVLQAEGFVADQSVAEYSKKIDDFDYVISFSNVQVDSYGITILKIQITPADEEEDPDENDAMTIAEQKEYMESVGMEFVKEMEATDFNNIKKLVRYFHETYSDYDRDDLEKWYDGCIDAITSLLETGSYDEEDGYGNVLHYTYNEYERLYCAANFTGHFEAKYRKWNYEKADDLQFTFADASGQTCVVKMTVSGSTKRIHVGEETDEWWSSTWDTSDYYIDTDVTQNYWDVPEVIKVTFTQNGVTLISAVVITDLASVTGEEIDLNKDRLSVATTVSINDYVIRIDKAAYSPTAAEVSYTMTKSENKIFAMSATATGNYNEDAAAFGAKGTRLFVDILGKIQIKGTCTDAGKFIDYIEKSDENDENESLFKSYINQANDLLDLGVCYNSDKKQAELRLEPFCEEDYYNEYWIIEPVFYFNDGASYSTFEAFFDKDGFSDLIHAFENMINDFDYLIRE